MRMERWWAFCFVVSVIFFILVNGIADLVDGGVPVPPLQKGVDGVGW